MQAGSPTVMPQAHIEAARKYGRLFGKPKISDLRFPPSANSYTGREVCVRHPKDIMARDYTRNVQKHKWPFLASTWPAAPQVQIQWVLQQLRSFLYRQALQQLPFLPHLHRSSTCKFFRTKALWPKCGKAHGWMRPELRPSPRKAAASKASSPAK